MGEPLQSTMTDRNSNPEEAPSEDLARALDRGDQRRIEERILGDSDLSDALKRKTHQGLGNTEQAVAAAVEAASAESPAPPVPAANDQENGRTIGGRTQRGVPGGPLALDLAKAVPAGAWKGTAAVPAVVGNSPMASTQAGPSSKPNPGAEAEAEASPSSEPSPDSDESSDSDKSPDSAEASSPDSDDSPDSAEASPDSAETSPDSDESPDSAEASPDSSGPSPDSAKASADSDESPDSVKTGAIEPAVPIPVPREAVESSPGPSPVAPAVEMVQRRRQPPISQQEIQRPVKDWPIERSIKFALLVSVVPLTMGFFFWKLFDMDKPVQPRSTATTVVITNSPAKTAATTTAAAHPTAPTAPTAEATETAVTADPTPSIEPTGRPTAVKTSTAKTTSPSTAKTTQPTVTHGPPSAATTAKPTATIPPGWDPQLD